MSKVIELAQEILSVLYLDGDGNVMTFEEAAKSWTYETAAKMAGVMQDKGYKPEQAKSLNPADFIEGWCIDDVKSNFEDDYPEMSDEVARYILHYVDDNHDATIGISWDVITDQLWNILWDFRYDSKKSTTVMEDEDAMVLLEELCKDHGRSPKYITIHDKHKARDKWLEENK